MTVPQFASVGFEGFAPLERLVVSPGGGRFYPREPEVVTTEGEIVFAGQVIGDVEHSGDRIPVTSPFTGLLMALMAGSGERIRAGQPVAWLRCVECP